MTATRIDDWTDLAAAALRDRAWGWSLGVIGAIAEFHRQDELVDLDRALTAVTAFGAIGIAPHPEAVAYRYVVGGGCEGGRERVEIALCLPAVAARRPGRAVLTELGPDKHALRPADREAILFDLGLDLPHVCACVRTADPAAIALLRSGVGQSLVAEKSPLLREVARSSPHRVFVSELARVEVYQPIPGPGERSPIGPHTHLMTGMLRRGRETPAPTPLPAGLSACLTLHPPTGP